MRMVLAYHELAAAPRRDVYAVTPAAFANHVAAVEAVGGLVTFDDAHISHVEHAPVVLQAAGLRGLFFAPTAHVGSRAACAGWAELRALLTAGHRVGSHTHTHPLLTHCSPLELWSELRRSRAMLEDRLGVAVDALSLPGGRGNGTVLRASAAAGYRRIYTSEPGLLRTVHGPDGCEVTVQGRLIVRRTTPLAMLVRYLRADPAAVRRLWAGYTLRRALRGVSGDALYGKLWRTAFRDRALEAGRTPGRI